MGTMDVYSFGLLLWGINPTNSLDLAAYVADCDDTIGRLGDPFLSRELKGLRRRAAGLLKRGKTGTRRPWRPWETPPTA